ncbi:MAG: hypothetical protein RIS84_1764 [Pseudomonadota bacterium]|jgi:hypothetical protein
MNIWQTPEVIAHTQCLLNTFQKALGYPLLNQLSADPVEQAAQLFHADKVVVSHGTQADPLLNYGNQTALKLWETDWEHLILMPSRLTAEPMERSERAILLQRVTENGYIDDYTGVRISTTGKRFQIKQAIVWNVYNPQGQYCGQAATFSQWTFL